MCIYWKSILCSILREMEFVVFSTSGADSRYTYLGLAWLGTSVETEFVLRLLKLKSPAAQLSILTSL